MQRRRVIAALAAAASLCALPYAFGQSGAPIRIGALLPMSGPVAEFGGQEKRAVEAAVEQVNARGGINGRKLEAIIRDSKADPTEAARLGSQLILDEGVVALVTGTGTAALRATDLTAQALEVRRSGVDSVLILASGGPAAAGAFPRKLRGLQSDIPAYGPAGMAQRATITAAGPAAEGPVLSALLNPDEPGQLKPLFDMLKDKGGATGFGSLFGVVATLTIVEGLKAGATDGASLRDTMEKLPPFTPHTIGSVKYTSTNHDGWGEQNLLHVQVRNGKFVNTASH